MLLFVIDPFFIEAVLCIQYYVHASASGVDPFSFVHGKTSLSRVPW